MDVSDVRDKLKTRLETITALNGKSHSLWPAQIHTPAALVRLVNLEYLSHSSCYRLTCEVELLAAPKGIGLEEAQEILDAYLDPTGASSVWAALEGDKRLQTTVDTTHVVRWREYGERAVNGVDYLGVTWDVEVYDS